MRRLGFVATAAIAALLCMAGPALADVVYAIAPPYFLVQFDSATPGTLTHIVFVDGLQAGERLEAIDFRPRTGQLFGLGVIDGATDTLRVYTINPLTGTATPVPGSTPITATSGDRYGFDFNPTVDRMRVTNDGDDNLRINPNNGARADTPTNDTDVNAAGNQIDGAAYVATSTQVLQSRTGRPSMGSVRRTARS